MCSESSFNIAGSFNHRFYRDHRTHQNRETEKNVGK